MTIQNMVNFNNTICLGIAGNFTGHLEQAGEASDFTHVKCAEENAPKGIFPFYIPNSSDFLGIYPISTDTINLPPVGHIQAEPECALVCDIEYYNENIIKLTPKFFGAFNDCSIRKEGAKKISEKKNWGANSKGVSPNLIAIDKFTPSGIMNNYNIVSFLRRDGEIYKYGVDSSICGYSYFYDKLLDWIIWKINTQQNTGPLEDISNLIRLCGYPKTLLITIGATCYTQFGEGDRLKCSDEIFVVLYPTTHYNKDAIKKLIQNNETPPSDISLLCQRVVDSNG